MKIFLVDLALYKMGGVERVISTLANRMVDKYDVGVCSLYRHDEKPFYDYDEKVKLYYLIDLSNAKSSMSKSKAEFYLFRFFEKICEQIILKKKITDFCEKYLMQCDIVIFGRTSTAILFLPYMRCYKGKIIVRDASHLYNTSIADRKLIQQYFPALVNTFIVSSEESKKLYEDFLEDNIMNIKKIYNPLGIIPQVTNHVEYKRIIGVGRYNYEKGFENLLLAFVKVHHEHPDWRLSLIGAGEDYHHYMKICVKYSIADFVEFRKSSDIVQEYCKSGIFVMTSRMEGYANALVEAMACGLPSISYDWYVGVDDIIQDGVNGIIVQLQDRKRYFDSGNVDPLDVDNLFCAINHLIVDVELRKKLSHNAVHIIESRNVDKIIRQWEEIIEEGQRKKYGRRDKI